MMQSAAMLDNPAEQSVTLTFQVVHTITLTGKPSEFNLDSAAAYEREMDDIVKTQAFHMIDADTPVTVSRILN